jgi:hypothetical protein
MAKIVKSREELEDLVLNELRSVRYCEDAANVMVVGLADDRINTTWSVSSFNPGTSETESIEQALWAIVSRLQEQFDIADYRF